MKVASYDIILQSIATVKRIEQRNLENLTIDTVVVIGHALKKSNPFDLLKGNTSFFF